MNKCWRFYGETRYRSPREPITGSMTRAGIINVIALRKVTEGTGIIAELISDPDPVVCRSAVDALGKIGTPEAAESLKKAFEGPDSTMKWPIANAWLLCADNMKLTDPDNALSIYMEIYDSNPPYSTLYAALRGIIACDQGKGESLVQNILTTRDPEWQTLVIPLVRNLKPGTDLSTYLDALPYLGEY